MTVSFLGGAIYPPGRWVPITVKLTNGGADAVDGAVAVVPRSDPNAVIVRRDVYVPARSSVTVELLGMFPDAPINPKQKTVDTATIVWTAAKGSRRLEEPLAGISDASIRRNGQDATNLPGVMMLNISNGYQSDDRRDASELAAILSAQADYAFDPSNLDASAFPRHAEALDGFRLIAIDPSALNTFDAAQRDALLTAIRGGVTLLLSGPDASAATTFLGPYLPLDVVGSHYVTALHPSGSAEPLPLIKPAYIADVAARDQAVVTLSGDRGPLAAYMPVGFGRVAMTAFSAHDLTDKPEVVKMWSDLIGMGKRAFHDPTALLIKPPAAAVLPEMIGATAPPWFVAAAVVGGYVAIVSVLLLISGQGRRPLAMAGCVGTAIVLTAGLLGSTKIRATGQPLMVGRLTTLDLDGDTASRQDLATFFGQQRSDLSIAIPNGATARPVIVGATPTLTLWPSKILNVGSSAGKLESVWQINRTYLTPFTVDAHVTFGPDGETLSTSNECGQPLSGSRLIVGGSVVPLPPLAGGQTRTQIGPRNASSDFSDNSAVLAGEESKLRTRLVKLETASPVSQSGIPLRQVAQTPILSGFIKETPGFDFAEASQSRDQTLVRVPLKYDAAAIGSAVRIDPAFTEVRLDFASTMPYLPASSSWYSNNLNGSWLFAVAAPPQVGRLRPKQLNFDIEARAGSYHIALRRGQCDEGKVQENPGGEVVAEWTNQSARRSITVDLTEKDIDANGWVWLRLQADSIQTSGLLGDPSAGGDWQFSRFDPTLIGTVDAAPQPIVHTWPYPTPIARPAPRPPAKKAVAKPKTATTQTVKKK